MTLTLVPAYGRDYKSQKDVKKDWAEGKDFRISNYFYPDDGRAINRAQAKPGDVFNVRYDNLRKIVVIKVK